MKRFIGSNRESSSAEILQQGGAHGLVDLYCLLVIRVTDADRQARAALHRSDHLGAQLETQEVHR
jgi:hypothetical protein